MKNIKILVCGDRDWGDIETIFNWLYAFNDSDQWLEITLIHGNARGADSIAGELRDKIAAVCGFFFVFWLYFAINISKRELWYNQIHEAQILIFSKK